MNIILCLMNVLYPLKFNPIIKEKIWGGNKLASVLNKPAQSDRAGESWELSAVQGDISVVKNGFLAGNNLQEVIEIYMADLVGEKVYKGFGIEFPLLVKYIDAADDLSIQVHPDDKTAKQRHNSYGKTEMWFVIDAEDNAEIITGFKKETDKKTYIHYVSNKMLDQILNREKVKRGDLFFLPAGRIHATGKGVLLAEIQQTSDVTYRIYDYDRPGIDGKPRDLHNDLALDVIDFNVEKSYKTPYVTKLNETNNLIECDYFTTNLIIFKKKIDKDYYLLDSFVIYMCLNGEFTIEWKGGEEHVEKGETVLIPASITDISLLPEGKTEVLEVYIK